MKLDKKNWKILAELDKNSRQTYSQLAKKIQLSQEAVRYRINQLTKDKIIQKFFTIIDSSKLVFVYYKILLKLHNSNERKIQSLIEYLSKDKNICWLASLDGNYDVGFVVKAENILALNNILEELNKKFNSIINKQVFSVNMLGEYLSRDYLINNKRAYKSEPSYSVKFEKADLDETDIKIIKSLTEDARESSVNIGLKLGLSADTILQRKRKLEKAGVIKKYTIVLNHSALNQIHYKVFVYLNNFSPKEINNFLDYCRTESRIVYIIKALGDWNYELDIEAENIEQYRKIMMEITNSFSNIVKDYNSVIVRKIHKYNLYP